MSAYAEVDASLTPPGRVAPSPGRARLTWLLAAAPTVAFAAQVFATDSYYTTLTKLYSGLLAALTAFVLARCVVLRPQRILAIEYALVFYYLTYGLAATIGPIAVGTSAYTPHADAFETAAALALVAGIAMLAGHAVWGVLPNHDIRRRFLPNLTQETLDAASGPFVVVGVAFIVALMLAPDIRLRMASVLGIAELLIHAVPVVVVATMAYALRPRVRTLALLTIAIGSTVASMIVSSMIGEALMPMVAVAVIWWRQRGRFPVALAARCRLRCSSFYSL